ncbi:amidohydrolase family protein [Lactobacillus sp. ESL0731]|uniref:amidohydrolase family protein n=1 Tax=unclassified Lactobacillus TaxID=2620435 RepID=UPI0023F902E0|nr:MULTISPECIES: amidohydrolase family protein [unclassified Lactobacillus]WEV51498.1 amidohydrolase family protein [Lactobacillus sp. ESL0700]WEV62627.1 amidohydrolase family protein [Lactobacillus sp. ESL0731]
MNFVKVIKGNYFTSASKTEVAYHENSLICLDANGNIAQIIHKDDAAYEPTLAAAQNNHILQELDANQYLLPGFIDLHVHAPQWPNVGLALNCGNADWFKNYTFPLEAKFSDAEFSRKVYDSLVANLLANGTTTVLYFGSVDNAGNAELVKACQTLHQRALIGKVVMDNPETCPDYYRDESTQAAIDGTEEFIGIVKELNQGQKLQMAPVITPRYLTSCTLKGMRQLGDLAKKYDLLIQSHCSENQVENDYALDNFHKRDSVMLDEAGLLTDKSIMDHGTMLNDFDLDLFQKRGVAIAHCPISNSFEGGAILPAKYAMAKGINVGLGTDICGGYELSTYETMRHAVMCSSILSDGVDNRIPADKRGVGDSMFSIHTAFYMATVGGAKSLHLKTGQIKAGYAADLQVVHSKYPQFVDRTTDETFQKLMYETTANEIDMVMTQGIVAKGAK